MKAKLILGILGCCVLLVLTAKLSSAFFAKHNRIDLFSQHFYSTDGSYRASVVELESTTKPAVSRMIDARFDDSEIIAGLNVALRSVSLSKARHFAQEAVQNANLTQKDFEYVYTHFQNCPPGLKDNLSQWRAVIFRNLAFTEIGAEGNVAKGDYIQWEKDKLTISDLFDDIRLDIEKLNN